MDDALSIIASITTITSEFSKYVNSKREGKKSVPQADHSALISKYIASAYERFSGINSFAFEGKRQLKDMYVSSTVVPGDHRQPIEINNIINFKSIEDSKVIIVDSAGMGKSTLSKFIFISSVDSAEYFPILIEARRYGGEVSLEKHIYSSVFGDIDFDSAIFDNIIKYNNTLILVDGLDEIPISNKALAFSKIKDFVDRYDCKIILTSRAEDMLEVFREVKKYFIQPLTNKKAFSLIRKIDILNERSDLLISKLESARNSDISEFLKNPMMVSLLYRSFAYKSDIPVKKPVFYRQVYDALYSAHDLSKGDAYIREKYCGLDIESFHRLTRVFAFLTYKDSVLELTKDQVMMYLSNCREFVGEFDFDPAKYLHDLYSTVPLFINEGDSYRWAHKSIQEYFASQFISTDIGEDAKTVLESIYNSNNFMYYINLIELLYDSNYNMLEEYFLYLFFKDIKSEADEFAEKNSLNGIDEKELKRRGISELFCQAVIFSFEPSYVVEKKNEDRDFPDYIDECFSNTQELFPQHLGSRSMKLINDKVNMIIGRRFGKRYSIVEMLIEKNSPYVINSPEIRSKFDRAIVSTPRVVEGGKKIYNSKKYYSKTNDMIFHVLDFEVIYEKIDECIKKIESRSTRPSLLRMK